MIKKIGAVFLAIFFIGFTGCQAPLANGQTELMVMAAASMTDALGEIAEIYKEESPNVKLNFTFGSSGALQAQIEEGAYGDVFLSAAQKQMNALEEEDLIETSTRKTLLENKIVLIAPKGNPKGIEAFEDAARADKIALGEPESVPVGQYSEEIFGNLNMLEQVKEKAVYGSDVRAVLAWVETGEVDCGVVYATDAAIGENIEVVCTAPEGSCAPVAYPVATLKASQHQEAAKDFVDFFFSKKAASIFEKYGFTMYEE